MNKETVLKSMPTGSEFYEIPNTKYFVVKFESGPSGMPPRPAAVIGHFSAQARKGFKVDAGTSFFTHKTAEAVNQWIIEKTAQVIKITEIAAKTRAVSKIMKAEAKNHMVKHNPVKVGYIFVTSWGYDQTNREFYQVTEVAKSGLTATVRQIFCECVEETSWCSNKVKAIPYAFKDSPAFKVRFSVSNGEPRFKDQDDHTAYLVKDPATETFHMSWGH